MLADCHVTRRGSREPSKVIALGTDLARITAQPLGRGGNLRAALVAALGASPPQVSLDCSCPRGAVPPEHPGRVHGPSALGMEGSAGRPVTGSAAAMGRWSSSPRPPQGTVLQAHCPLHLPGGAGGTVGQAAWSGAGDRQPVTWASAWHPALPSEAWTAPSGVAAGAGAGAGGAQGDVTVPEQGGCDRHTHRGAGKVTLTWGSCLGVRRRGVLSAESVCVLRAAGTLRRSATRGPGLRLPTARAVLAWARAAGVRPSGNTGLSADRFVCAHGSRRTAEREASSETHPSPKRGPGRFPSIGRGAPRCSGGTPGPWAQALSWGRERPVEGCPCLPVCALQVLSTLHSQEGSKQRSAC